MLIAIAIVTLRDRAAVCGRVARRDCRNRCRCSRRSSLADTEIDPEWWMEFREHARGLEATFTPAVLGFAATLDGLSGVLDGRGLPVAILAPAGALDRRVGIRLGRCAASFSARHARLVVRGFVEAGRVARVASFIVIAAAAAIVNLILYLTVHRLLFGPIHRALVAMTTTERDAFFVRVVLYLIFFALIAMVSLIADYARVAAVAGRATSPASDDSRRDRFHPRACRWRSLTLYVMTGAIFVAITVAYGTLEIYGGSQVGGWRAIAIGQAYVLVRLAIRLTFAASELRLFNANHAAAAQ